MRTYPVLSRPNGAFALIASLLLSACAGGGESPAAAGSSAATPSGEAVAVPLSLAIGGKFKAPVGAQVVLQLDGAQDQTVTIGAPASSQKYGAQTFTMQSTKSAGESYSVSVKTPPLGMICSVHQNATGTLPVSAVVAVGCEYEFDLITRSSSDLVFSGYNNAFGTVIGGNTVQTEGRYLAFWSSQAGLTANSTGATRQAYWRDRLTGETLLVSANAAGTEGNAASFNIVLSADGLSVAFDSAATNLVSGDGNQMSDVFVWSATTRLLQRVSLGSAGQELNDDSTNPSLSADGKKIAFQTYALRSTPEDYSFDHLVNTYVLLRDLNANSTTLVSRDVTGTKAVTASQAVLSEDGNTVAFYSYSDLMVSGDSKSLWDNFVRNMATGTTRVITNSFAGGVRNQGLESISRIVKPTISGNGRYVAFATTATNVVAVDSNTFQDVFVYDLQTNAARLVSFGVNAAASNGDSPISQGGAVSLSYDGQWVSFSTTASNLTSGSTTSSVLFRNLSTGESRTVAGASGNVGIPQVSRSASYLVFGSFDPYDKRFSNGGLYTHYTGIGKAWWWTD
jgi:WD40-like Beta Propeller Repeat